MLGCIKCFCAAEDIHTLTHKSVYTKQAYERGRTPDIIINSDTHEVKVVMLAILIVVTSVCVCMAAVCLVCSR